MRKFPLKPKVLHLTLAIMLLTVSLPRVASSQAFTTTSSQVIRIVQVPFVPCAFGGSGESVFVSGNLHVVSHLTINQNRMVVMTHFQPQGETGLGLITGDVYHRTGVIQFIDTIPVSNGAQTFTSINNFGLISPGSGSHFRVHHNIHVTINANGEFIVEVNNFTVDCN